MKEKTFEELLTDDQDFAPYIFGRETVLKLLQQVREATKKEAAEITRMLWRTDMAEKAISNLPKDRIKTESVQ